MEEILLGLDVGTTKICALVGEVKNGQLRIIGMGIQPSRGMRKGMVIDVGEASIAIARALESAERTSGYDLSQALVSMAGEHIGCVNNRGVVAIGRDGAGVTTQDIEHALDVAQAIPLPHNRQIVHLVPRNYMVDDQTDVRNPIGMHGFRLEVEAHLITAAEPALKNLSQCVDNVGVRAEELVLNALASAEAVLEPAEREMGVIIADIGGGTTDIALYMEGHVWHTKVIPVGGYHITNDIAIGMRAPYEIADRVKIRYGDCRPEEIDSSFTLTVDAFNETIQVGRQELAHVIEARADEIFQLILQEIRQSGYDGLLPAGIVLTGGTSQLRGIAEIAERVLNVPARVAGSKSVEGLVDPLQSPAYATSVGLLRWAMNGHNIYRPRQRMPNAWGRRMKGVFKALLP